jgi:hypothetical protein
VESALKMHLWDPPYLIPKDILPPRSVVRVRAVDPDWDSKMKLGDTFRIGYYSKQDGPNVVWLVNAVGEYQETWDQVSLLETFEVVERSDETDIYGVRRPTLEVIA